MSYSLNYDGLSITSIYVRLHATNIFMRLTFWEKFSFANIFSSQITRRTRRERVKELL